MTNCKKIVECVPNFSEGRNKETIDAISAAIRATSGVTLLDVDPGPSTNRTVFTFVGDPGAVVEGALNAAKEAFRRIDMTKHKGSHPRMGALDVCPFIPVTGVTVAECVEISKAFGRRLSSEVDVPVFLYGAASTKEHRKSMPQIRAGEYEGLKEKLQKAEWMPDFGKNEFVPSWGATVTGVRKFLIAYNINMVATKEQAHRIALNLREQGRGADQPGRLKCCQAIGWFLEERNIAQISVNLTDFDVTPIHVAYEEAKKDAEELNLPVTGSEIVGLIPLASLLQAAEYYIEKENLFILEENQKIHLAINRLGLSTLSPFNPKERVIEYCLGEEGGPLERLTVGQMVKAVAARTAAPGGGSVAANVAALGSALGAMVCQLTYGKKQWQHLDGQMRKHLQVLYNLSLDLIPAIDADTEAFDSFMSASKLPKGTADEISKRTAALKISSHNTVKVPMNLLAKINTAWPSLLEVASIGNVNCLSDVQTGVRCLEAGAWGAYYNVMINLDGIEDKSSRDAYKTEAEDHLQKVLKNSQEVLKNADARKTK